MKRTRKPTRSGSGWQVNSIVRALTTTLLVAISTGIVHGQCREGDCENGRGTYDFGWSKYAGDFIGGKPHGLGVIDYGDYRYEGPFEAGNEHGRGTLFYPDGRVREIEYERGKEVRRPPRVEAFSDAEGLRCVSGDCENGRGRYVSNSGAVYEGDFQDGRRNGQGHLTSPFGDVYEGSFKDQRPHGEGAFRWASGYVFTGSFVDGVENTGSYTHPDGRTAGVENGEVVRPAATGGRTQTIEFKIVGDRVIIDKINGVDADGRKRMVLYTVGHVTRELYWSDVPVAVMLTVYEVDAPHDMDLETIRRKIYEQVNFVAEGLHGSLKKAYPTIYVAPGTHAYDALSFLSGEYGREAWTKAKTMQFRLDW